MDPKESGTTALREGPPTVERVVEAFEAFGRALHGSQDPSWMESDLTMAQLKALAVIWRSDTLPVSGVAHRLGVGLPTASHLVDCLVRAGLVERHSDPADRRVVHCAVTAAGRSLVEETYRGRTAVLARLVGRLDDATRAGLCRALTRLTELAAADPEREEDESHGGD
jgi:DNA-binding MarR family transcriptional regulator